MARLLFDTPWWLPAILIFLGGFLLWTGNQRQEAKLTRAGIGLILAAVIVILLSWFIDTDAEKAVKATRGMVSAIEQHDWTKLRSLLSPSVTLAYRDQALKYGNAKEIVEAAQVAVDRFGLKKAHVLSTDVQATDQLITVTASVISEQDFTMGRPLPSSWRLEWERGGNTWVLVRITCLSPEAANQQFPQIR